MRFRFPTRLILLFGWLAVALAGGVRLHAQASVSAGAPQFLPAAAGRTYMDVGGVWNGTARIDTGGAGDVFEITYTNNSNDDYAYDLTPQVILPTGFTRLGSPTVSVTTGTTPSISASGTTGTVNFTLGRVDGDTLGAYDLPPGGSITLRFSLRAEASVTSGTYTISHRRNFSDINGGTLGALATAPQDVTVHTGARSPTASPLQLTLAVNETGTFTYTIVNIGSGGLFDVALSEVPSNPGPAWDFSAFGTITAPRSTTLSNGNAVVTIPYLAPGESMVVPVNGVVTDCVDIGNDLTISDLVGAPVNYRSPIALNLQQPLLDFTLPTVSLVYGTPVPVSITLQNNGLGAARGMDVGGGTRAIRLVSNLNTLGVVVSNIASGWSYNAGEFRYTANNSFIDDGASATLTFDLTATDPCTGSPGGTLIATAYYENSCGGAFGIPTEFGTVNAPTGSPTLSLDKSVSSDRLTINEAASYTVTLSATNLSQISTTSVVVTDTLHTEFTNITLTPSTGTANLVGNVVTWTVPTSALSSSQTLQIDFTAPATECLGGTEISNTASTNTLTTTAGCSLSATGTATFLLGNSVISNVTQVLNATPAPDGYFETGSTSADVTRDTGEGEFIELEAIYTITPNYPGRWAGTTYTDNFGGNGGAFVTGSAEVAIDGGAYGPVPPGSIGAGVLDLSFLAGAGYFNTATFSDNTNTRILSLRYKFTVPDSALGSGNTRQMSTINTLTVARAIPGLPGSGACVDEDPNHYIFREGAYLAIARAAATVGVAMPVQVSVCEVFPVTLTVSNATVEQARNLLVTLTPSVDYEYIAGQTPTYGGAFNGGNITVVENAGNTTFTLNGGAPLTATGTITVNLRRKADGSTTPSAVSATLDYDDYQTSVSAGTREFSASGSASPAVVNYGYLSLSTTPQNVVIPAGEALWATYVTNGGNGIAYSSELEVTFPTGLPPVESEILAANTALGLTAADVDVVSSVVTIRLGDIAPGASKIVYLVANVSPGTCTYSSVPNAQVARWGCAGDYFTTVAQANNPSFTQPAGSLQVSHESSSSYAVLCDTGTAEIVVSNPSLASVYNISVTEVISSGTGVSFVPGSVRYSVDNGSFNAAPDPTGAGTSGSPYTWTSTQIPELAELASTLVSGPRTIRIRYDTTATETANGATTTLTPAASGAVACGTAVNATGSVYSLPLHRPSITVVATGINRTAAGGSFGTGSYISTVRGGTGDVIEWKLQITNSGNFEARNVRAKFDAAGDNGTLVLKDASGTTLNASYTSGTFANLPAALAAGTTVNYYIVETVGATCVDAPVTITAEWGCDASDPYLTAPATNTDTANLRMRPRFDGNGTIATDDIQRLENGRARQRITFTNGGGNARALVASITMPSGLDYDASSAATIQATTGDYPLGASGLIVSGSYPNYVFTLTPLGPAPAPDLRYQESVTIEFYVLPRVFDTTANTIATMGDAATAQSPESTGNGLDPAPPNGAATTFNLSLAFDGSCGAQVPVATSRDVNPNTPDLDIEITPTSVTFAQAFAPYTYTFAVSITNNGESGSVADRIVYSLPTVGSDWASVSAEMTFPGSGGSVGTTTTPPYNTLSVGTLAAGQTATVKLTVVTQAAAATPTVANLLAVSQVEGNLYNQAGADTGNDYSLDRVAPYISSDFNLSGYLYLDANHDGTRQGTETGLGSGTYYVKAISTAAPTVAVAGTPIDATSGFYSLSGIPQGDYTVIVDDNNTLADVTPTTIAGYVGTEMPGLSRNTTVGVSSVANQNFGLFRGSRLAGMVFNDNGAGGGTANDATKQAGEAALPAITVSATDGGSTTYDSAPTAGDGSYLLYIPYTAGAVTVLETQPASYRSIGGSAGTTGGTYTLGTDRLVFTAVAGTDYTGANFAEVPDNSFENQGEQNVVPGSPAFYPHVFIAGTAGKVTFTVAATASPALSGWSEVLYLDANANGAVDTGEPIVTPTDVSTLATGQVVHLVLKELSPAAAPFNSRNRAVVSAEFVATTGSTDVLAYAAVERQDLTITGSGGSDGLTLVKSVDKASALPNEVITYTITFTNNGSKSLSSVVIYDQVPAWTLFQTATAATPPADLTGPTITAPAVNATTGAIVWTFGGTLAPGASGTVTYTVKVQQ